MIRGGGSATGTIIKDRVLRISLYDGQHVLEMSLDELGNVLLCRNCVMAVEYGIRVYSYIQRGVIIETSLFRRNVSFTQKTGSCLDRLLVYFSHGRLNPVRVVLDTNLEPLEINRTINDIPQAFVIIPGQGPGG